MDILKVIQSKGFTLAQVAEKLKNNRGGIGITVPTLSATISNNPGIDRLKEIADVIGVSLPELVADAPEEVGAMVCPHCGKPIRVIKG